MLLATGPELEPELELELERLTVLATVTIGASQQSRQIAVAGLVLTTECLVTEIPIEMSEEMKQQLFDQQAMGAGMGPGIA